MTRAEMTEIFSVFMLAWPNAETFRASSKEELAAKLGPTITLWTACLRDVDFWTGQQAVVRACRTCKFPPTIAEFLEAAKAAQEETKGEIAVAARTTRNLYLLHGKERGYELLPDRARKVIDAMGGMDAFAPPDSCCFALLEFEATYEAMLRKNPVGLPRGAKALG